MSDKDLVNNYVHYVESGRNPDDYIPVAEDVGGNIICVGLRGGDRGKLFFWDHELESTDQGGLAILSRSFEEFLHATITDD